MNIYNDNYTKNIALSLPIFDILRMSSPLKIKLSSTYYSLIKRIR